jgi:nucleoid DNA-binding protein
MGKTELVAQVAKKAGVSKVEAARVVNAVLDVITEAVKGGQNVTLTGFGTFRVRQRKAREGRNPRTGQKITIPATRTVSFAAGSQLAKAVKGK